MPSLTLRKPSAPSPDAVAAFVGNDEADPASLPPRSMTPPAPALRTVPSRASAAPAVASLSPTATASLAASAAPSFRRASRAIVERRTRSARRRTTVYLDVDVATKLAGFLLERDQELSDTVNAAVQAWLDAQTDA